MIVRPVQITDLPALFTLVRQAIPGLTSLTGLPSVTFSAVHMAASRVTGCPGM